MAKLKKSAKKKVVSLPWPEIDKVELSAHWIDGTSAVRFAVNRKHDGHLRGRWEFEYGEKNDWTCTRASAEYLRDENFHAKESRRDTDETRIPDDIALKAREFLSLTLQLNPKRLP